MVVVLIFLKRKAGAKTQGKLLDPNLDFTFMPSRSFTYWSKIHGHRVKKGNLYTPLSAKVVMFFLSYCQFDSYGDRLQTTLRVFGPDNKPFPNSPFRIDFIELPKIERFLKSGKPTKPFDLLSKWVMFLRNPDDKVLEDIMMTEPKIKKAKEKLKDLSQVNDNWIRALSRQKALDRMNSLHHEGIQEGVKKGQEQILREIIERLLAKGQPPVAIAEILDIPMDKILDVVNQSSVVKKKNSDR